jgi:dipeptidyl aminopeptidase/acylaminoacyl peptidase
MKPFRLLVLVVVMLFHVPVPALSDRPITPEDLYRIILVGDPRISPDGAWIAYTRSVCDLEKNSYNIDIWLVPAHGGPSRRLTSSAEADHSPRWSPDGSSIAFVSGRRGSADLYVIPVDGGEARRITSSETGLSAPIWASDGKHIVCRSRVVPEGKEPRENWTAEELPHCEARTIDHLLFRQWDRWLGDERNHLFLVDIESGEMRDLTPGDEDVPPVSLSTYHDFDISPNGKEICYVKKTDPIPAVSTNHDLFTADLERPGERKLTENPALDCQPHYSPDGRYIAYAAMEKPGYEADRKCLVVYDRKKGTHTRLTDGLDRSVGEILWAPDGRSLFFTTREEGRCSIYRADLAGAVELLVNRGYNTHLDISADGSTLCFLRSFNTMPYEVFTMRLAGGSAEQRTAVNAELLEELDLPELEEFWFSGAGGARVHGFIQKPPDFDPMKRYPVVLTIHGGPQNMWADRFMTAWFTFPLVSAPGYVGVFINPRGSTGYGSAFREAVSRDYGGRCFEDLMLGLDHVIATRDYVDGGRVAAIGGSFGGYCVNWMMGHTDRFVCFVSHAGLYNLISFYGATEELWFPEWDMGTSPWEERDLYERWSPHVHAASFKTPTLVTHGERDYRVPFAESLQLFTALQRQGVPSRLVVFPGEGHVIYAPQNNIRWWREIHRWLERYLQPE